MKIPLRPHLAFSTLGAIFFMLLSHQVHGTGLEVRKIHTKFRKNFPRNNGLGKHTKWLQKYGSLKGFPYFQKHMLELTDEFSILSIKNDSKIIESVGAFFSNVVRENRQHALEAFAGFRCVRETVRYLIESGFLVDKYSFDELLHMFAHTETSEFDYSRFATDPELIDFIHDWPKTASHFNSYHRTASIHHLLTKERKPAGLVFDMLKMNIGDLETFSDLPAIVAHRSRSILLPLFERHVEFGRAPNIFRVLSRYPDAVECLGMVKEHRKQDLIVLFPHHANRDSCDEISDLDLREKSAWRMAIYEQRDYFAGWYFGRWSLHVYTIDKMMAIDDNDARDLVMLDWLWVLTSTNSLVLSKALKVKGPEITRLIVNGERQSLVYQMLAIRHVPVTVQNYKGDEPIRELDEEHWNECSKNNRRFDEEVDLLLFLLVPQLCPDRISRIALSVYLNNYTYRSESFHVDSILGEYMLRKDQSEIKMHTIKCLGDMFEIGIDPSILDELNTTCFKEFATRAYEKVRETSIQWIGLEKLSDLAQKQQKFLPSKVILREITSRIINEYSEDELQAFLIKVLIQTNGSDSSALDRLRKIEDAPAYLNFLYHSVDDLSSFFYRALSSYQDVNNQALSFYLDRIMASGSFGLDFLCDVAALAFDTHFRTSVFRSVSKNQ